MEKFIRQWKSRFDLVNDPLRRVYVYVLCIIKVCPTSSADLYVFVRLVVNGATRNAQCATDNLSVILWAFGTQCEGTTIWFWGGGAVKFCLTDNLFSAWARSGNLFSCGTGSGKNYFRVNMVNHSPLRQLINTRNSNVIESSGIRWNY